MGQFTSPIDRRRLLQGFGALFLASACCPTPVSGGAEARVAPRPPAPSTGPLVPDAPENVGMSFARLQDAFARLERRVNDEAFPGFAALVARHGKIVAEHAYGRKVRGGGEPVTLDTLFDLESMTKVVSTAISALVLVDQGKLRLDDPVVKYLTAFQGEGKERVTVRDMLRYSSGLPLDNRIYDGKPDEIWRKMAATPLEYPPGTKVEYSDLTYRLLGKLVEVAAGTTLDVVARDHVWRPLGMVDTTYNPPPALKPRIAATGPTERRTTLVRGAVQDDLDFLLGGVCGCDGAFSTVKDVAAFCQMVLGGGTYAGKRILAPELAAEMVANQTPFVDAGKTDTSPLLNLMSTPKGFGWELFAPRFSNGGIRLSPGSYGKAGGAGTYMWVDPSRQLIAVLLTNHGLPQPFDERGWNRLLDETGCGEFFDGVVGAVTDGA
ncbi:serine hydrolase domain-containing protein [Polyangium sorediatum]|uniref:Serine hydrolase domain-containing protein n=1 Tax=Polyangium sorediatum TaxID=889274 RepID=A0ABT6NVA6_9BACT|nr:serine hydrolase domain-containing protein [Polyangium sorediatum]MDI1432077.1 serine hydrolase domain-containing protein [Polyangium sorediatum]